MTNPIELADELERLKGALRAEKAGAETLDEEGMAANDKLGILANLVLDLKVGTPYGQKVKAYARFALSQGPDPLLEVLPHEQEGSESDAAIRSLPQPLGDGREAQIRNAALEEAANAIKAEKGLISPSPDYHDGYSDALVHGRHVVRAIKSEPRK